MRKCPHHAVCSAGGGWVGGWPVLSSKKPTTANLFRAIGGGGECWQAVIVGHVFFQGCEWRLSSCLFVVVVERKRMEGVEGSLHVLTFVATEVCLQTRVLASLRREGRVGAVGERGGSAWLHCRGIRLSCSTVLPGVARMCFLWAFQIQKASLCCTACPCLRYVFVLVD